MTGRIAVAACLSVAVVLAAAAAALAGPEQVVTQKSKAYGTYLSDDDGHAVYMFTTDKNSMSACRDACAKAWPPMMTSGAPLAGPGVKASLLGTVARDGGTQVTYAGKPLYYFAGDKSARSTEGQGINHFGGSWYLMTPMGAEIEKMATNKGGGSW